MYLYIKWEKIIRTGMILIYSNQKSKMIVVSESNAPLVLLTRVTKETGVPGVRDAPFNLKGAQVLDQLFVYSLRHTCRQNKQFDMQPNYVF